MKTLAKIICTIEEGKKPFAKVKIDASTDNLLMGLGVLFNSAINKISRDTGTPTQAVKEEILKFISKERNFEAYQPTRENQ